MLRNLRRNRSLRVLECFTANAPISMGLSGVSVIGEDFARAVGAVDTGVRLS